MAIRRRLGFDGVITSCWASMLRWFILGSLIIGVGLGFRNQWIVIDWPKFYRDVNLPFLAEPEPTKQFQFKGRDAGNPVR